MDNLMINASCYFCGKNIRWWQRWCIINTQFKGVIKLVSIAHYNCAVESGSTPDFGKVKNEVENIHNNH